MQLSDEKDQRIIQLEKVNLLEHNVEVLTQAVLHAAKQRFGASSEKTPPIYVRQAKLGISDRVKVSIGQGLTDQPYRVLRQNW